MFKEIKEVFSLTPLWFKVLMALTLVVGIALFIYTVGECGLFATIMLGEGGPFAAYTGMCDR